jgi:hypothetical protein
LAANHPHRHLFTLVFTATTAGLALVVTGLIGFRPPGQINLAEAGWRRGVWVDGVLWDQLAVGTVLLLTAAIVAYRLHRRMAPQR